ncbi:MAG TPA: hypothetical protein VN034_13060 [Sphingopyxis sp.]|nr:hypothetical protein [Sphingopyxis sp.]
MAFQPLGYRFEISSTLSLEKAKSRIRQKKKGWFDPQNGARGWIVGPFMCLWLSAFNQHGPMVVARLKHDGMETKIVGRAGADLNGTALFLFLTPLMAWLVYQMARHGQGSTGQYIILGLLFGAGLPLTLWVNAKDRREADPLVHFVRKALSSTDRSARSLEPSSLAQSSSVRLIVNGEDRAAVSADRLSEALSALSIGDFAVLEFAPDEYMQALSNENHYIVEKREGSAERHFRAILPKGAIGEHQKYEASLIQLRNVMTAYLHRQTLSSDLNWKRITL